MPRPPKRKRITNAELAFLENTIAAAIGITQRAKALAYWIDDPDALEIILDILKQANTIRKTTIEWKHDRKQESTQCTTS